MSKRLGTVNIQEIATAAAIEALKDKTKEPKTKPDEPITKSGDLWILGKYRVMCGDYSVPEERHRLLEGVEPEISELIERLLSGGSGTLIACNPTRDMTYIMELTPEFTDTIVKRYIRSTGDKDIQCIRDREELPIEAIGGVFEDEGGGNP